MSVNGLEATYLANREKLLSFLKARGAGEAAEDVLQDLWLKVSGRPTGPIANPLSYLFRAANTLMIDRYRAQRQARSRDQDWSDAIGDGAVGVTAPTGERAIAARQEIALVTAALARMGTRREAVWRRARLDGVPQRQIAMELGVSIGTIEGDLRAVGIALAQLKEQVR